MWPLDKGARDTDGDFAIELGTQTQSFGQYAVEGLVSCRAGSASHGSRHLRMSVQPLSSSIGLLRRPDLISRILSQLLRELFEGGCLWSSEAIELPLACAIFVA
jgi:hypothetical protein